LQTILNVVDFEMDIQAAIEAGKIHHQWLPDRIQYEEEDFDGKTIKALKMKGHELYPRNNIGSLMGIRYYEGTGIMEGGADSSSGDGGVAGF
jgi:gamma-glutamyltranspeptidase/glutathione hydrolase